MPKVWYVAEAARGHAYPGHPECPDRVLEAAKFLEGLKFSKWAEASGTQRAGDAQSLDAGAALAPLGPAQACGR